MKVKIGNVVYDPNVQPLLFILSDQDKKNILAMLPNATKYCCYPAEGWSESAIRQFMEVGDDYTLDPVSDVP